MAKHEKVRVWIRIAALIILILGVCAVVTKPAWSQIGFVPVFIVALGALFQINPWRRR